MTAGESALSREDLRALVRDLCTLGPDRDQVRALLHDAGVPEAGVRFDDRSLILWTSALQQAHQQGRVTALLQLVHQQYRDSKAVQAALEASWDESVAEALHDLLKASDSGPTVYGLIRLPLLPLPARPTPSTYLKAQHAVVPFTGRAAQLEQLLAWCQTTEPFALQLLIGPGGIGKTRLLMELCDRLRRQRGWTAGFIGQEEISSDLQLHGEGLWLGFTHQHQATLVVLDYAESRVDQVQGLLRAVYEREAGPHPLRVVLLAREVGGWWEQLGEDFLQVEMDSRVEALKSLLDSSTSESIQVTRVQEYHRARAVFVEKIKPTQPLPEGVPDLSEAHFGRVLMVHTLALLSLESFLRGKDPGGTKLLDELLIRERAYWRRSLGQRGFKATEDAVIILQHAMTLVTLGRPAGTQWEALDLLHLVPQAKEYEIDPRRAFIRVLHEAYPSPSGFIDVLQPDVFGEHVVFVSLTSKTSQEDPSKLSEDGKALIAAALDEKGANPEVALTVLARLAARRPQEGEALLEEILEPRLEQLTEVMVRVMIAGATGLLMPVERLIEKASKDGAQAVVNALPERTQVLAEFGVRVTQLLVDKARREMDRAALAGNLNNLSNRLSNLGRLDAALHAIREAVNLYRGLAFIDSDTFTPDLAASLNTLSSRLGKLGWNEEALAANQEAVDLYRKLARFNSNAFTPDLAGSLNNLSSRLGKLGWNEEALAASREAADLYRELARFNPNAFTPDLAMSLNTLSVRLAAVGHREQETLKASQEAVDMYRKLARFNPDAFTPDLAMSLNTLSNRLGQLKRREEALAAIQEAVNLYRELARFNPDAFTPDLAMGLTNFSNRLSELGRREEGIRRISKAVAIFRRLTIKDSNAFKLSLASTLSSLGDMLSLLGRYEKALDVTEEAHKLYEASAHRNLPDLANSFTNLALRRLSMGQQNEALIAAKKATAICDQLEQAHQAAFLPRVAIYLNNLAYVLERLGDIDEAMKTAKKAVDIQRTLFQADHGTYRLNLVRCLDTLADIHVHIKQHTVARTVFNEALRLVLPLVESCDSSTVQLTERIFEKYVNCLRHLHAEHDEDILRDVRFAIWRCARAKTAN